MKATLRVTRRTDLREEEITVLRVDVPSVVVIGRHVDCGLRLEDHEVSRQHARIVLGRDELVVEDVSSNGTAISTGEVLRRVRASLPYGGTVRVGPFEIAILAERSRGRHALQGLGAPRGSRPDDEDAEDRTMVAQGQSRPVRFEGNAALAAAPAPPAPQARTWLPPAPVSPVPAHAYPQPAAHPVPTTGVAAAVWAPLALAPHASPTPIPRPPTPEAGLPVPTTGMRPVARPATWPATAGEVPVPMTGQVPVPMTGQVPVPMTPAGPVAAPPPDRGEELVALRRQVHAELLKNLDFAKIDPTKVDPSLRPRVLTALKRIVKGLPQPLPSHIDHDGFIGELLEEALGLGPLEPLLADPTVTEIMVVDPATIYVERFGRLELTRTRFTDEERVRAVIERIVTPLGRRIDESQPLVDARLPDGSRVNAIIRPLALRGSCITIRRFPKKRLMVDDFVRLGSLTPRIAKFLERAVVAKKNILISGGTGSGKTTLLNVLSASIPSVERIVTIEDAAELQLHQPHVVSLETKHANMEGKGAFTIRDLVKNALRMRPDRIVVGECRGGEALDMLQAMNTGHDGSLTTIHANSPVEALSRLETLVLMSGVELPSRAIREQISRSIHVIVQQTRFPDGTRKITHVAEIDELDPSGRFEVRPIFEYEQTGTGANGAVLGDFQATGYLPSFVDELLARGIVRPGEAIL